MYQVFCLKGTPPETLEEQDKCFRSKTRCWRLANRRQTEAAEQAQTASAHETSSASR